MSALKTSAFSRWLTIFQVLASYAIGGLAVIVAAATMMAAFGVTGWPDLAVSWNGQTVPAAGMYLQVGLTVILLAMLAYLPGVARILRLERSHRDFTISMQDVARAYALAHAGDRKGAFALSSEFDAVRARIRHMRDHPDLASLEPGVLEVAAQMSQQTQSLAAVYSDEKVRRAKAFLAQRQEEVQALKEKIAVAQMTCDEIRRWREDVVAEERVAEQQLLRLEKDLREVLPALGYDLEEEVPNVVQMAKPTK